MPFGHHTFDNSRILLGGIDCTFSKVITGDHEGSFSSISGKFVKEVIGIEIRSIIEGKRNIF